MKNPKILTEVVHSQSKSAWNIIGKSVGKKYKIARIPYTIVSNDSLNEKERTEAFEHAEFISYCFNNSTRILESRT